MTTLQTVDPFRPLGGPRYTDDRVIVERLAGCSGVRASRSADGRIHVTYWLLQVDDELAEQLAAALTPLTDQHDDFVRAFVGVVLTSDPDPDTAWLNFYRSSLQRIRDPARDGYAEVYRHAVKLLPDTDVVDLGAGLGFLALHLAASGVAVTAVEPEPGTALLLARMAGRLGIGLRAVRTSAADVPDKSADAVALIHVIEHVSATASFELLDEAIRIARHRVVVAVPFEPSPTRLYGHVRAVTPDHLAALGAASGLTHDVHQHHGGWLVLDLPPDRSTPITVKRGTA